MSLWCGALLIMGYVFMMYLVKHRDNFTIIGKMTLGRIHKILKMLSQKKDMLRKTL
jgi:hypothetical protein